MVGGTEDGSAGGLDKMKYRCGVDGWRDGGVVEGKGGL